MKKLILIAIAAVMTAGMASAQIVQTTSSQISYRKEVKTVREHKDYNRIALSYNRFNCKAGGHYVSDSESLGTNGVGLEYVHGFNFLKSQPMYIETGVKLMYHSGTKTESDDYDDYKYGLRGFNISIPLNYVYRLKINDEFSVLPYTGLNFRINCMAEEGENDTYYGDDEMEWTDLFDDYYYDEPYKRFQLGWNIGAGVQFGKLYLGLGYTLDMMKAFGDSDANLKTGNFNLTLGVQF